MFLYIYFVIESLAVQCTRKSMFHSFRVCCWYCLSLNEFALFLLTRWVICWKRHFSHTSDSIPFQTASITTLVPSIIIYFDHLLFVFFYIFLFFSFFIPFFLFCFSFLRFSFCLSSLLSFCFFVSFLFFLPGLSGKGSWVAIAPVPEGRSVFDPRWRVSLASVGWSYSRYRSHHHPHVSFSRRYFYQTVFLSLCD